MILSPVLILTLLASNPSPTPVDLTQTECIADAIYAEARSEPLAAQVRVASAVLNRGEPCIVVRRPNAFATPLPHLEAQAWTSAVWVAILVQSGAVRRSRATHFHDTSVRPYWVKGMTFLGQSGTMKFWVKA